MRIDVVAPLELSPADIAAWERMQAADPALANPFLSPHWPRACAEVDGPDRKFGRVLVLRDAAGEPVGFTSARLSRGTARAVGAPMCDYQGVVSQPGVAVEPRALVRALGAARYDFTHFLADQAAFAPFMRGRTDSQIVDISRGYEAYAAEKRAGGHDILKDTAKKARKFEREVGEIVFTAQSDSTADFDALIDWKRKQYRATRQTDIFDAGWPLELLRNLHARQDANFRGALFTLHVGGKLAAANYALVGGGAIYCWFIAHDADFGKYSPGVILIDRILQWGSAQGMRELDFGPGDYRFKLQLANATREIAHGFVGRPSPSALMREAQYRVRTTAEALPLGRVSHWPGKAMRRVDLWMGLR
jgi:CelD/BcsL family acetyltransferase involved in cellulose biosynthesis